MRFKKISLIVSLCLTPLIVTSCGPHNEIHEAINHESKEVYKQAQAAGFGGTYEEWLEQIKGKEGKPGTSIQSVLKSRNDDKYAYYYIIYSDGSMSELLIPLAIDGAKGETGSKGETGNKGEPGDVGDIGPAGPNGHDGQNGNTPYIGSNGNWWIENKDTGIKATGPEGETGNKGETGDTGSKGETGDQGRPGQNGQSPYIGFNGNWWIGNTDTKIKATGNDGQDGQNGQDGTDGNTPYIGFTGNWFIGYKDTGIKAHGDKGDTGEQGIKGETGDAGIKGETGDTGADGNTPYIGSNGNWWIGNTDTKVKATGSKGETGDTGIKGETGNQGYQGDPGFDGTPGVTPHIGPNGTWWIGKTDTGVKAEGEVGQDGQNGKPGIDGKTPYIGTNGNWWINNQDTGVKAEGVDGQNGQDGHNGQDGQSGEHALSTYETYKKYHPEYNGSEADFEEDLKTGLLKSRTVTNIILPELNEDSPRQKFSITFSVGAKEDTLIQRGLLRIYVEDTNIVKNIGTVLIPQTIGTTKLHVVFNGVDTVKEITVLSNSIDAKNIEDIYTASFPLNDQTNLHEFVAPEKKVRIKLKLVSVSNSYSMFTDGTDYILGYDLDLNGLNIGDEVVIRSNIVRYRDVMELKDREAHFTKLNTHDIVEPEASTKDAIKKLQNSIAIAKLNNNTLEATSRNFRFSVECIKTSNDLLTVMGAKDVKLSANYFSNPEIKMKFMNDIPIGASATIEGYTMEYNTGRDYINTIITGISNIVTSALPTKVDLNIPTSMELHSSYLLNDLITIEPLNATGEVSIIFDYGGELVDYDSRNKILVPRYSGTFGIHVQVIHSGGTIVRSETKAVTITSNYANNALGNIVESDIETIAKLDMSQNYSDRLFKIQGNVVDVYNMTFGNMHIADNLGNQIDIYGTCKSLAIFKLDTLGNITYVNNDKKFNTFYNVDFTTGDTCEFYAYVYMRGTSKKITLIFNRKITL